MNVPLWRAVCVLFVCQSLIFTPLVYAEQLSLPSNDLVAPEVSHEAITTTLQEGASLQIQATVTDNVGIKSVTLYYRNFGSADYKSVNMHRVEQSDNYSVTLGQDELVIPGIEYYIQAIDIAGNSLLHGYSFSPLKVSVASEASLAQNATGDSLASTSAQPKKKKSKTWLWITVGAVAVGAIAAVALGGGGGEDNPPTSGAPDKNTTITVTAPAPTNNQ